MQAANQDQWLARKNVFASAPRAASEPRRKSVHAAAAARSHGRHKILPTMPPIPGKNAKAKKGIHRRFMSSSVVVVSEKKSSVEAKVNPAANPNRPPVVHSLFSVKTAARFVRYVGSESSWLTLATSCEAKTTQ